MWQLLAILATAQFPAQSLLEVIPFRNQNLEGYPDFAALAHKDSSKTIPGLSANFVPQGICWIPDSDQVLISGYQGLTFKQEWQAISQRPFIKQAARVDEKASVVILLRNGVPKRIAYLADENGDRMSRHAGGIAVWNGSFWIPGNYRLYRFPLKSLLDGDEDVVTVKSDHAHMPVDSTGSFISAYGDDLLIGDFGREGSHPTPSHHRSAMTQHLAWTAAYRMDKATNLPISTNRYLLLDTEGQSHDVLTPDYVLHHRQLVQGIAVRNDGLIALSLSYGDTDSKIAFYRIDNTGDASSAPSQTRLPNGSTIPSWTLSEGNWTGTTIKAPPGSEGLAWNGKQLAIAFEGGAYPYRERWTKIEDRIILLNIQ